MRRVTCFFAALTAVAVPLLLLAQAPQSASADIQAQLGDLLMSEGRFREAIEPYRRAAAAAAAGAAGADGVLRRRAQTGVTLALLRLGEFAGARVEAERLSASDPSDPRALALYGDTLWAFGLFDEAERAFDAASALDGGEARALHGRARALAARGRLADALVEAQMALRLAPREAEFHHTVGTIYERMHQYEPAAAAFGDYMNLLPNHDRSEKGAWTRSEIRFLDSFKGMTPGELPGDASQTWTVPIRIEGDKVLVRVKVNGGGASDFVLDTGAEQSVVSRDLARRRSIEPITFMPTAGVGDIGLRGLEVGRINVLEVGSLKVRNVPCLIKNPPLGGLPARERDSFSPLPLGLSMRIDYLRRELVMARALPQEHYGTELPLSMYRLATVRGIVNGRPARFVVDTGGEVLSISASTAGELQPSGFRHIPLKVYGSSGWDRDAFLLPNVDVEFSSIRFSKIPVVVLNLKAPSALLGFQIGGIVGHKFLSHYRVTIDLLRSVVGLQAQG